MIIKYNGGTSQVSAMPWKNTENTQKPNIFAGNQSEDSVRVVISKEGLEEYRKSIASDKSNDAEKEKEIQENLSEGIIFFKYRHRFIDTCNEINAQKKDEDRYLGTAEDDAASMLEAYAVLYDEIIRGYEDGTRVTYEKDESAPEGYRILTKEEELELLDQTFADIVNTHEIITKREHEGMKIIAEDKRKTAAEILIRSGRTEKYLEYIGEAEHLERRVQQEKLPENFAVKMIRAMELLKSRYAGMFDQNAVEDVIKHAGFYETDEEASVPERQNGEKSDKIKIEI